MKWQQIKNFYCKSMTLGRINYKKLQQWLRRRWRKIVEHKMYRKEINEEEEKNRFYLRSFSLQMNKCRKTTSQQQQKRYSRCISKQLCLMYYIARLYIYSVLKDFLFLSFLSFFTTHHIRVKLTVQIWK